MHTYNYYAFDRHTLFMLPQLLLGTVLADVT